MPFINDLPQSVLDKACRESFNCEKPKNRGFVEKNGLWVCSVCLRPTIYFIEECDSCGEWFMPDRPADNPYNIYTCQECDF